MGECDCISLGMVWVSKYNVFFVHTRKPEILLFWFVKMFVNVFLLLLFPIFDSVNSELDISEIWPRVGFFLREE